MRDLRTVTMWIVYDPSERKVLAWHRTKKAATEWREGLRDPVIVQVKGTYLMPRHLRS